MPSLHLYIIEKVEKSKSRCQFPKSMKKVDAGSRRTLTTSIFPVPEVDEKRQCRFPKSMQFLVYQADFLPKKRFHFSTFCKNVNIFYLECTFIVNIFKNELN